MTSLRRSSAYAISVVVVLLFACGDGSKHDHDNFREDVIMCEDAVSYLVSCCPGFNAHAVHCNYGYDYTPGGCYGTSAATDSVSPALSLEESRCILGRPCNAIVAAGVCARAQAATPYTSHSPSHCTDCGYPPEEYDTSSSHPAVCP
jgi:hypothetical protein